MPQRGAQPGECGWAVSAAWRVAYPSVSDAVGGAERAIHHAVCMQGLHIAIKPHLDDGTGKGAWRNGLLFQPATKYGAYSYADIMLYPGGAGTSRA